MDESPLLATPAITRIEDEAGLESPVPLAEVIEEEGEEEEASMWQQHLRSKRKRQAEQDEQAIRICNILCVIFTTFGLIYAGFIYMFARK